jgi:hypothetical protein
MQTKQTTAGWIVADTAAIYAAGATRDEAIAAWVRDIDCRTLDEALRDYYKTDDLAAPPALSDDPKGGRLYVAPATAALIAQFETDCWKWGITREGICCTLAEQEAQA